VKRVPEGPVFSREPGNLTNLHSHKYSGLANAKTIDVREKDRAIVITTRKKDASVHAVKGARATTTVRAYSGPRRALGIAAKISKRGYRADLRPALLGRVSRLLEAQREKKPLPAKKVRGKKATKNASA